MAAASPTNFATKVRSAGVWFSDYNLAGLSMTPRVYLVPAGTDIMRSPSSYELETREFEVVDQKLPVPFPIGATDLGNPAWIPINDSLSETFGDIRRFSSFRQLPRPTECLQPIGDFFFRRSGLHRFRHGAQALRPFG